MFVTPAPGDTFICIVQQQQQLAYRKIRTYVCIVVVSCAAAVAAAVAVVAPCPSSQ